MAARELRNVPRLNTDQIGIKPDLARFHSRLGTTHSTISRANSLFAEDEMSLGNTRKELSGCRKVVKIYHSGPAVVCKA